MEPQLPEVGPGSPAGKRWFVCKWAEFTTTIKPEYRDKDDHGNSFLVKGKRAIFTRCLKPIGLVGTGELGRGRPEHNGTDKNESLFWGILVTSDPETIECLRLIDAYKLTTQDNRVDRDLKLKELNWDPTGMQKASGISIQRRGESFGPNDGMGMQAPAEADSPQQKGRVGLKSKAVSA